MFKSAKKLIIVPLVSVVLSLIFIPCSLNLKNINLTSAQTEIYNRIINTDTVWTITGSPYLISYDYLFIRPGATLTIEPGVIVKLERASIIIDGAISAVGDENNPVIFTSINDDARGGKSSPWSTGNPQAGDWGKIETRGQGVISLDHAIVNYGGKEYIALIGQNFPLKINTAYAQWEEPVGALSLFGQSAQINHSQIAHNIIGIEAYADGFITVRDSEIYDNTGGGILSYGQTLIDAVNNWWGDDSGPYHKTLNPQGKGDKIIGNVLFDPWIGKTKERNPVIIVPGILGSYLNDSIFNNELWPNFIKMSLPGPDNYLDALKLNQSGEQDENNPMASSIDIFRKISNLDFFAGLIQELENNGYEENKDLFVFPYDWRFNLNQTAGESQYLWQTTLKQKIIDIKNQTGAEKVDIVAHSMGGLVVKNYIEKYGGNEIDKFIDIATPHLGAPSAFKTLNFGDNLGFIRKKVGFNFGLNSNKVKQISQNMPSIYQLLPSRQYFESTIPGFPPTNGYIYDIIAGNKNAGILAPLNYDQTIEFLDKEGRNDFLLGRFGINAINVNDELHGRLDNLPDSENYYNIIGCGQATYAGIIKKGGQNWALTPLDGDGTVPLKSALPFGDKKYYTNITTHPYLPSAAGVRQLAVAILQNKESDFDFSAYQSLSQDQSVCGFSGTQIGAHSPVELHVYDEDGNHVGPTEDGDIEINIVGATYDILGEDKYAFLPAGKNYRVINQASSGGELAITIEKIENSQSVKFVYFSSIQLNSDTTAVEFNIIDNQEQYEAKIDFNGDGIIDQIINPDSILSGEEANDLVAPEITIIIPQENQEVSRGQSLNIEYFAVDNLAGVATATAKIYFDNPIIASDKIDLFGKNFGEHEIKISIRDLAGNLSEEIVKFSIIIDLDGTIANVNRAYDEGLIAKDQIKKNLIKDLTEIKKLTEKYGKRIEKKEELREKAIAVCLKHKDESWCEEKIGKIFDKIEYRLDKTAQTIIKIKYNLILKKLELYQKKNWLLETGYSIIKEDVEYLLSKLK